MLKVAIFGGVWKAFWVVGWCFLFLLVKMMAASAYIINLGLKQKSLFLCWCLGRLPAVEAACTPTDYFLQLFAKIRAGWDSGSSERRKGSPAL